MTEQIIAGIVLANLNVRDGAGVSGNVIGWLRKGTQIEGDIKVNQWIHLTRVDGVPVTDERWISDGGGKYVFWEWMDAPEPTPEPPAGEDPETEPQVVAIIKTFSNGDVEVNGTAYPL